MSKVNVRVVGRNPFRGRAVGEVFAVSAREAKVLVAARRAVICDDEPAEPVKAPEPVVVEAEAVAEVEAVEAEEEAAEEPEEESEGVEISERTGLPKRQYRRRDLTASE